METIAKGLIIVNDRDSSKKEDHTAPILISKTFASLPVINNSTVATGRNDVQPSASRSGQKHYFYDIRRRN